MNEKKTNIAALILSVVVVFVAVFGVKFAGGSVAVKEPADNPGEEVMGLTPGTYTAEAKGLEMLSVTITIDENGQIADVVVDGPGETAGIGTKAIEALPEAIRAAQSAEVDIVANATLTSNGIIEAATACLAQAAGGAGAPAGSEAAGKFVPGTYTAEATGLKPLTVTVTIGEDGNIAEVVVDGPEETPGIGTNAIEQLPEAIKATQSAEVDIVAGATLTSNGIIEAATSCLEQASAN